MSEFYGIDISSYNGAPDLTKAKGISVVILRVTERNGIDKSFEHNYESAKKANLKIGGYKFSYAKTAEDSRLEAKAVLNALNGRWLEYPIFLDLEWETQEKFSKSNISEIIEAFREVIVNAGYNFAIYTSKYWYENIIPESAKKYDFWIASLPSTDTGEPKESLRPTYKNTVGWQYSWKGAVEGLGKPFDMNIFYTDYSEIAIEEGDISVAITAEKVLDLARSWLGKNEADGSHKSIIDIYNNHTPRARGYKVKYTDQWCDTCLSALFIALGVTELIGGTECGVEEHVKLFKAAGIWIEDGTITPVPGDIIVYNWDKASQPNDGYSDHIGIVEKVSAGTITTIEGNYRDSVARRKIKVGNGYIRGYARPKYGTEVSQKPDLTPSPAPEPAKTYLTLKSGNSGVNVVVLQKALNVCGYPIDTDGFFGNKTYAAVTSFQNRRGLVVDGVVGLLTWTELKREVTYINELSSEVLKNLV